MKLAFSTLGCPDWKYNEIMAMAKDFGFDGVEVRGIRDRIYAPDIKAFGEDRISESMEKKAKLSLEIPMLTSGICVQKRYDTMISEAKAYAALADKIGAKYIRILADDKVMPTEPIDDEVVISNMKEIVDATKEWNAIFLIETNGAYADSKRLKAVIEKIGSDKVGALWDIHHPYRFFNESPETTGENLKKYIKYIHIKDSTFDEGVAKYKMMGEGDMPIDSFIAVIKSMGYDGYLSLEWVKRWNHELQEPGIVFMQYINYMRKKLR